MPPSATPRPCVTEDIPQLCRDMVCAQDLSLTAALAMSCITVGDTYAPGVALSLTRSDPDMAELVKSMRKRYGVLPSVTTPDSDSMEERGRERERVVTRSSSCQTDPVKERERERPTVARKIPGVPVHTQTDPLPTPAPVHPPLYNKGNGGGGTWGMADTIVPKSGSTPVLDLEDDEFAMDFGDDSVGAPKAPSSTVQKGPPKPFRGKPAKHNHHERQQHTIGLQSAAELGGKAAKRKSRATSAAALGLSANTIPGARKKKEQEDKKRKKKEGDSDKASEDQQLLDTIRENIVQDTGVTLDEVVGLRVAKEQLNEALVMPIKFPNLFGGKHGRTPAKGILLYGLPGTGKSFLAAAVAGQINSTFFSVVSSSIVSKWQGQSAKLIRALFTEAKARSPSIIFIDEIDSLCTSRSSSDSDASRRIKTEFLTCMDGVSAKADGSKVLVLAATNYPDALDSALLRRFSKRICIDLPDLEARAAMFRLRLSAQSDATPEQYTQFAQATEGYSGSDIEHVCNDALMEPVRDMRECHCFALRDGLYEMADPADPDACEVSMMQLDGDVRPPPTTAEHVLKAISRTKSSVASADRQRIAQFKQTH
ncbi:hypothetical protein KIPB_003277 [Kipferlia bialata]|uniref:AAA+ ATPase domain-containing protein n=1 Tax=Kipferlia bialata TaxID=797122 RepID=A0A9K3CSP0_9EUKA|nr:hypothetical protein KIPB_003277 [Kipferlia bialata]|eukprot:g3277.t1